VFEHLGGPLSANDGTAEDWPHADIAALNLVAIDCLASADAPRLPGWPGCRTAPSGTTAN
jgi:precorrin-6Y C5,15-methyltransferase (decarboxylating)